MLAKQYAQALQDLSVEKLHGHTEKLVDDFLDVVVKNGHKRLLPGILREFERLVASQKGEEGVEITVARSGDEKKYLKMIESHKDVFPLDSGKAITVCVDERLLGGYVLKSKVARVDNSYRKHLLDLYATLLRG